MRKRMPCEFFLIRYVPDAVKGEFVNIGVLLREAKAAGDGASAAAEVRFTRDWRRVRCLDADADLPLLEALEQEIAAGLKAGHFHHDGTNLLAMLQEQVSNSVQMTEGKATLAESLPTEMEQLMRRYVEPLRVSTRSRASSGRALLTGALRTEFERAGVWGLMRKRIAAARYTRPGDPLRLDCGYLCEPTPGSPDPLVRIFQAVSLAGEVEGAKGLAFSAPHLREGMRRVEAARLELTAVVEPLASVTEEEGEEQERYRFGVEMMERQEIRVVTLNDLARVAETARRDLGM